MAVIPELATLITAAFMVFGLILTTMIVYWLLMRLLAVIVSVLDIDL